MAFAVSARHGAFRDSLGTTQDNRQAIILANALETEHQAE